MAARRVVVTALVVALALVLPAACTAHELTGDGGEPEEHDHEPTPAPTQQYQVVGCNVTVGSHNKEPWSGTHAIDIQVRSEFNALLASVAHCAEWRIVDGGLMIRETGSWLVHLEALSGLRAIGKSSSGWSLYINENSHLASLAGLRNVRGALPGALVVTGNPSLTSLSGLEGITRIEGKANDGTTLHITDNSALCLFVGTARA